MSAYSTGSATIIVGSQSVTGNGTRWDLYAAANNVFKITSGTAYYTIANVVSSCELMLSGRYADALNQTLRANENLATVTIATKIYSGIVDFTPIIQNTVTVIASNVKWEDNGAGVLATVAGAGTGVDGTIDYDSGSWYVSVTSTANIVNTAVTASYNSGNTLNAMPYQIITDYTPNYNFAEVGVNDANIAYTITKTFRDIDSRIHNATINTATVDKIKIRSNGYVQLGSHQYIFFGNKNNSASVVAAATNIDASVKGSLYLSSAGSFWKFTTDATATAV